MSFHNIVILKALLLFFCLKLSGSISQVTSSSSRLFMWEAPAG